MKTVHVLTEEERKNVHAYIDSIYNILLNGVTSGEKVSFSFYQIDDVRAKLRILAGGLSP